jgi:hypothetical protein
MSKAKHSRIDLDYYATPAWCTRQILDVLHLRERDLSVPYMAILDPSCGDGAILRVAGERGMAGIGIELDEGRAKQARAIDMTKEIREGDALAMQWPLTFWDKTWRRSVVALVGNPPFSLAGEFAGMAAEWSRANDRSAALLLRLSFAESQKRAAFHRQYPSDIYVLPVRPRFRTDTNGTDAHAYAWFVWGPFRGGRWQVLPMPPKEER